MADMARQARGSDSPIRITTAPSSAGSDISARQKRYLIAMGVRTGCFLMVALLAITHIGPSWCSWVFVAGAIILPYVAVVMANATETKSDGFELQDSPSHARELPQRTETD